MSGRYQMELLNKIAFNRYGGTEDELRAANIIKDEIERLGGSCEIQNFEVAAYEMKKATFTVTEPYYLEIEVEGVGRSGSTPEEGIEAEFIYAETCDEIALRDAKGKIVLVNHTGYEAYKRLVNSGALGFVVFSGAFNDLPERSDIDKRLLRPNITENGRIPGVCMRCADAIKLVQSGATKVKMTVLQEDKINTSRNVTAVMTGSEYPDEEILLTAHYDSTIYGNGAWDNASGSVNIMELYKHLLENPPKRTVRFIWCGSEEQGLLGSKAYCNANPDEVEKIRLCINFDMTGTTLGYGQTIITGSPALRQFAEQTAREIGYTSTWQMGVHSSDSAPFAKCGVPSIGVARSGQAGGHSRWDIVWPLSEKNLEKATDFGKALLDKALNAKIFPIDREMPSDMMEKLETYFLYGKKKQPANDKK